MVDNKLGYLVVFGAVPHSTCASAGEPRSISDVHICMRRHRVPELPELLLLSTIGSSFTLEKQLFGHVARFQIANLLFSRIIIN